MTSKQQRKSKVAVRKRTVTKRPAAVPGKNGIHARKSGSPPPKLSAEAEALRGQFVDLVDHAAESQYALAQLAIGTPAKITAAGFESLREFWERCVVPARPDAAPSYSTLTRWTRVARTWPETAATQWGFNKLDSTLTWLNLKHLAPPKDPSALIFAVPRNGDLVPVPFAQCSEKDVAEAIRRLKEGEPRPLDADSAKFKKDVEDVFDSLMPHGAAHVRFVLHQDHAFVDLKDVPRELLVDVCKRLLERLAPSP
jgi:hypothetical protein